MDPVVSILYVTVAAASTWCFQTRQEQLYRFFAGGSGFAYGYGSVSGMHLCICATLTGKHKTQDRNNGVTPASRRREGQI